MSETKLTKTKKNEISKKILDNRIDDINKLEKDLVKKIQDKDITEVTVIKSLFNMSGTAKNQLERGGEQLTKADLISIIIALDSSKLSLIENLQKLTNNDLNKMIRVNIHDRNRLMMATNNCFMNMSIQDNTSPQVKKTPKKKLLDESTSENDINRLMMTTNNCFMNMSIQDNAAPQVKKTPKKKLLDESTSENKIVLFSK